MTQMRTGTRLAVTRRHQKHVLVPQVLALRTQPAVELAQLLGAGMVEIPAVRREEIEPCTIGLDVDVAGNSRLPADVGQEATNFPRPVEQLCDFLVTKMFEYVERDDQVEG